MSIGVLNSNHVKEPFSYSVKEGTADHKNQLPLWQKITAIAVCILCAPLLIVGGYFAFQAITAAFKNKKIEEWNNQHSKNEFKNPESEMFDFTRTVQMKNTIKQFPGVDASKNTLFLNKTNFTLISSKTRNFFDQPVASCGSSLAGGREVLLLDPAHSPVLAKHFEEILKIVSRGEFRETQVLQIVSNYVRDKIFPTHNSPKLLSSLEDFVKNSTRKIDVSGTKVPVMTIDSFISSGLGVCRHHALVTAYILDGLTKRSSTKTGKPFLNGIVQHIRDDVPGGAHAWVTYVTKTRKMHIDTLWNQIVDFSNHNGQNALKSPYGAKAIENQMQKIDIYSA